MLNTAELTIVVFEAIIALVSFVGNSLVCFVVIRNRDMRTAFNFMIVNLALGDIFYTTFLLAHFTLSLYLSNPYDITGNSVCIVLRKLTWLGSYSAVCTMIVIARERYYTIVHPHESKGKLTMQKLKVLIPITWLLSLLINTRGFVLQSFSGDIPLKSCDHNWTDKKMHKIHLSIWGFFVTVSSVTMITFYSIVVYTLWFKRSNNNQSAYQQQGVMRMRKRVTLMVLVVSAMFEICWITDTIIHVLQSASSYAIPIAHTVIMFSSAVNPFVYSLISQRFRAKMKDMLLCITRLSPDRKIHASEAPYVIQFSLETLSDQVHTKETSDATTSGTL